MSDEDRQQRIQELRRSLAPSLQSVEDTTLPDGTTGRGIALRTNRGTIQAIIHEADAPAGGAVMWVCGARGGYAGPAEGMYATLAEELTAGNVTSLRLNYRHPADLDECVWDVLIGLELLRSRGCARVALVGHSFGGAVVIAAAGFSPEVAAVVALSSQTHGAQGAPQVSPRLLLIVHGTADTRLPPWCAERIHEWAREPKELVLYDGAEHGLLECKDELHGLLRRWLPEKLRG
jgi:alpha-beta hydrolase superfamily lysophospholipase